MLQARWWPLPLSKGETTSGRGECMEDTDPTYAPPYRVNTADSYCSRVAKGKYRYAAPRVHKWSASPIARKESPGMGLSWIGSNVQCVVDELDGKEGGRARATVFRRIGVGGQGAGVLLPPNSPVGVVHNGAVTEEPDE